MQSAAKMQKISGTQRVEQLTSDFELLTHTVQSELAEDHFGAAAGHFREAVNLTRSVPELKEIVVRLGIDLAYQILPQSAREEAVAGALTSGDAAASTGMLPAHLLYVTSLLNRYPAEPRLQSHLTLLEARAKAQADNEKRIKAEISAKASEASQFEAGAVWALAREFSREGFVEEALDQLYKLREMNPAFPGLPEEMTRLLKRKTAASAAALPEPVRESSVKTALKTALRRLTRPHEFDRNFLTTAATLAFILVTISTAGGLLWMNHSPRSASQRSLPQNAAPVPKTADDLAWSAVDPKDPDLVEAYLNRFPAGANRELAIQALSQIRVERRQVAEVHDVLRQYTAAWNARNVDSILSLRRNLDRQAVQAQLSPLKSMVMNLSPASAPRIEGDQATVRCLQSVSEVYADGQKKRSPDQDVTFVLAKRGGAWKIESAPQSF